MAEETFLINFSTKYLPSSQVIRYSRKWTPRLKGKEINEVMS